MIVDIHTCREMMFRLEQPAGKGRGRGRGAQPSWMLPHLAYSVMRVCMASSVI